MEKIVTTNDLRRAYPHLVREIEDECLIKLGIVDSDTEDVMSMTEDEKKKVRNKAKHIANITKHSPEDNLHVNDERTTIREKAKRLAGL